MWDKTVVVTQPSRLDELLVRFGTRAQAKFYVEHMGLDFSDYAREDEAYRAAVSAVVRGVSGLTPKLQRVERSLLATFQFTPKDLVVVVGRDGLVVNTAKYVGENPVIGINPDARRWDGVLLPFAPEDARQAVAALLAGRAELDEVTMAQATLNDGQRLLAFNDFMIGRRTHASARYAISWNGRSEEQSSSGVLVSTGAGSTGWLSSTRNMAQAVAGLLSGARPELPAARLGWSDPRLVFVVREPFLSRSSGVQLGAGFVEPGTCLRLESHMPEGGVIFSDGVEEDALAFTSGLVAEVRQADKRALLVRRARGILS